MNNPIDFLYTKQAKGLNEPEYNPPDVFRHGEWEQVARFEKDPINGDGQSVTIYESRLPASFYKIVVDDGENSVHNKLKGFSLSTGSGSEMGKLCFAIARAVSEGMIGMYHE